MPAAPVSAGMQATADTIVDFGSSISIPTRRVSRRISVSSTVIRRVGSMSRLLWRVGGSLLGEMAEGGSCRGLWERSCMGFELGYTIYLCIGVRDGMSD